MENSINGESTEAADKKIEQGINLIKSAKAFGGMGASVDDGSIPGSTAKAAVTIVEKVVNTEIKSGMDPAAGASETSQTSVEIEEQN